MKTTLNTTRPYAAAAAILYAVIGLTPMGGLACSDPWIYDDEGGMWRLATPTDQVDAIGQLNAATHDALAETPAASLLPWADYLARVLAILVAFRWTKPNTAAPQAAQSKEP